MRDIDAFKTLDVVKLTKGMKNLDDKSYRTFFQLYYRRLWSYLFILNNGNERDVEDVIQLVFTKVIKNIKIFKTDNEFWAWLAVVSRNTNYDFQRKERNHTKLLDIFRLNTIFLEETPAPNENLEEKLDCALHKLEKKEINLIERKYLEGDSYRQIAAVFQVTEKAIESRLARIRKKLRNLLLEET